MFINYKTFFFNFFFLILEQLASENLQKIWALKHVLVISENKEKKIVPWAQQSFGHNWNQMWLVFLMKN